MDTNVERLSADRVRLNVTASAEEVDKAIDAAYKRMAAKVKIPGFRSGKAPRPMIDTHVGREAVIADAQDELLNDSYAAALDQEDLRPLAQPEIGELELMEAGAPFEFSAEVDVRPELTLSSVDGLSVTAQSPVATEREIDAQVDHTRERFASLEPVEDRGVQADDFILLSFIGKVDGEEYEGNTVDKYLYEMNRGLMPPEFDDGLVGMKVGDEKQISFVIPDTSNNPDFVDKTATFDVTVHEIKAKVLPEVDDEFATNVGGYDTVAEMRDAIREQMNKAKQLGYAREVERSVRAALAERLEGDVPQVMVDNAKEGMKRDFVSGIESQGMTFQAYLNATGVDPEQVDADIAVQATQSVREELALEALFRQMEWEITEEDIDAEIAEIAGADNDPAELRKKWEDSGVMTVLKEQIMHHKAVNWLMDAENVEVIQVDADEEGAEE